MKTLCIILHGYRKSKAVLTLLAGYLKKKKVNNLINEIKESFPQANACRAEQLFYSAGVYGNNGQLYKMDVVDKNYNDIGYTFYIYF